MLRFWAPQTLQKIIRREANPFIPSWQVSLHVAEPILLWEYGPMDPSREQVGHSFQGEVLSPLCVSTPIATWQSDSSSHGFQPSPAKICTHHLISATLSPLSISKPCEGGGHHCLPEGTVPSTAPPPQLVLYEIRYFQVTNPVQNSSGLPFPQTNIWTLGPSSRWQSTLPKG